ncbi:MAG: trypsin-like peptidase domain-containing protein [Sinobacteraceae bacterium]|nr:trypsin-like peptidase domain-containing protein [Nevskiaceae bacterium]MCP5466295.1 trypsin-like peptidase domain-containing protein [Nevskiaceae bacterium]MCP5471697.1 trypsin-like peptidase domain-containing protein [Nevskiaceae bacterium]
MNRAQSGLVFLAGSVVGGLALAFLIVVFRPELLPGAGATGGNTAALPAARSTSDGAPASAGAGTDPGTTAAAAPGAPAATLAPVPAAATAGLPSYAPAVQRAAPAVVNVYTARVVTERVPRNPFEDPFGELAPRYRQRIERSLGSGVIVDADGHIVTNHHVIADADSIRVQLADGRVADAKIVGRDPDTDLALLRIGLERLPVMPLGRSDQLQVGDVVLTIGNPIGLSQTVTQGIVSATGRGQLGVATFENFIQTDAPINVGNSGGALINAAGELVGINTAVIGKNLGVEGIGFAIPVNLVRGVLTEIISTGRVVRGWIGVVPEDIEETQARQLGLARGGVVITNLYVGSPAQAAGLRPGDIVLSVGGTEVGSAQEVLARVAQAKPGTKIELRVQRGRETSAVPVEITERPRTQA